MRPTIDGEIVEDLDFEPVITKEIVVMPPQVYAEDRAWYFDELGRTLDIRPLDLRNALSNFFILMARSGQRRERHNG